MWGVVERNYSFLIFEVELVIVVYIKSYDRFYDHLENGVNGVIVEDIWWLCCDIKSLNLLGNVLVKEYVVKYNVVEVI